MLRKFRKARLQCRLRLLIQTGHQAGEEKTGGGAGILRSYHFALRFGESEDFITRIFLVPETEPNLNELQQKGECIRMIKDMPCEKGEGRVKRPGPKLASGIDSPPGHLLYSVSAFYFFLHMPFRCSTGNTASKQPPSLTFLLSPPEKDWLSAFISSTNSRECLQLDCLAQIT